MTSPPEAPPRPDQPVTPAEPAARPVRVLAMTFGILLLLVAVAWICFTLLALLARRDASENRRVSGTIRTVAVQSNNLSISVSGTAPPGTATVSSKVSWSWGSQPRLSVALASDGTLRVGLSCSSYTPIGCQGRLQLVVPAAVAVTGTTSDGALRVEHVQGALRLNSSDGNVTVDDASGSLNLDSSDGHINATGLRSSRVVASSSDGEVTLQFASPPSNVNANSSDGGVHVLLPPRSGPYRVDASSSDGGTHTEVRTDPESPRLIVAHSSDGGVHVSYQDG